MKVLTRGVIGLVAGLSMLNASTAHAQQGAADDELAPFVIVPQKRAYSTQVIPAGLRLTKVDADIQIVEQVATTTLAIEMHNPSANVLQAQILVPVPAGVTVRKFALDTDDTKLTANLLPADEARRIYESIVREMQDPGLLEFIAYDMIRTSVFPIAPAATQRMVLTYEQILPRDGKRVDFFLPRSESLDGADVAWTITGTIQSRSPISAVYSPSHDVQTQTRAAGVVDLTLNGEVGPGAFRLSYLQDSEGVATTVLAYPDESVGGGYFLLLAGLPNGAADKIAERQKREVIVVIDRSGSMRGEKVQQARAAAIQVLEGLDEGEAFNIIDYSDSIAQFAKQPVIKTDETMNQARSYLQSLTAGGGTDIHSALATAVSQTPTEGMLPMVLFLTDGLPTAGRTGEREIRDDTEEANAHKRRIFTFGVGYDVNAPLLDKLAETSRAASINVLPGEDIEVAVTTVFRRLDGPVLAFPTLTALDGAGDVITRAVRELQPASMPDLFDGDQVVVLGQYSGTDTVHLRLVGDHRGNEKTFDFRFDPEDASLHNGFVARLWASRKIANLVDEVRQTGANGDTAHTTAAGASDELVKEIVNLSMRFGILTEYTAFLAEEPAADAREVSLRIDKDEAFFACGTTLDNRAVKDRAGIAAVNQAVNIKSQQVQTCSNPSNRWFDANMNLVECNTVQQLCDQTLFKRGTKWVDARIVSADDVEVETPERVVEFATPEYFLLATNLVRDGRTGMMSMPGDVYMIVNGQRILVKNPELPKDNGC